MFFSKYSFINDFAFSCLDKLFSFLLLVVNVLIEFKFLESILFSDFSSNKSAFIFKDLNENSSLIFKRY